MAISKIETDSLASGLVAPTATALTTASGSAPSYSARAWVNFNGTGTVAIRASGNVSSITDNGTGDYTVNFATALADANYSMNVTCSSNGTNNFIGATVFTNASTGANVTPTTSAARLNAGVYGVGTFDPTYLQVSVFR